MSVIGSNALAGASGQGSGGYEIERSLRFNSGDSAYLNRTLNATGSGTTGTYSFWIKRSELLDSGRIVNVGNYLVGSGYPVFYIQWNGSNDSLIAYCNFNGLKLNLETNAKFRDPSAWYHVVVKIDTTQATNTDRAAIYVNGVEQTYAATTWPSQNDNVLINLDTHPSYIGCRESLSQYLNAYLADIHFIDGQALTPSDFGEYDDNNVWQPKKYSGSYGTNGFYLDFSDNSSNSALGTDSSGNGNDWTVNNLYADTSFGSLTGSDNNTPDKYGTGAFSGATANTSNFNRPNNNDNNEYLIWTPSAPRTAGSTLKVYLDVQTKTGTRGLYVNGSDVSSHVTVTANTPATNIHEWSVNLSAANITSVTSVTTPQMSSGTTYLHGISIDGIYVADYGLDVDQSTDSPTNGDPTNDTGAGGELSGNYATLNPLVYGEYVSYGEGNLYQASAYSTWSNQTRATSTIGVQSGKWYWEQKINTNTYVYSGIVNDAYFDAGYTGGGGESSGFLTSSGNGVGQGSNAVSGNVLSANDVMMWALDLDNDKLWVGVNGTWYSNNQGVGDPATGANPGWSNFHVPGRTHFPAASAAYGNPVTINWNFGARRFNYNAPTGFKCICTANLPDPTIEDGSTAFDVVTYTSDGSSRTISGLNMSPDLVWSKKTSASGRHVITDSVRGVNKEVFSNLSSSERTSTDGLTAFNSDGYTLGADAGQYGWQANGATFVNWAWDAGSSNTTIAAGGLNSSKYNQSQTWSSLVTGTLSSTGNSSATAPFQGTLGTTYTDGIRPANGAFLSMNFGTTFANATTLKLTAYGNIPASPTTNSNLKINGSNVSSAAYRNGGGAVAGQHTVTLSLTSGLTSLEWGYQSGGDSGYMYVENIEVDGKLLVNSGVTPPNIPSIASTVSANPSAGFAITTYTGNGTNNSTIAHNLNAAPAFVIIKNRDNSNAWAILHTSAGTTGSTLDGSPEYKMLTFDSSNATDYSSDNIWEPTTNTVKVNSNGTGNWVNGNGYGYVMYSWTPVDGYSKFGKYYGNALASGPFVYTGFRPAYVLTKGIDDAEDWYLRDTTRSPSNPSDEPLRPNDAGYNYSGRDIDILSNGFKIRTVDSQINEAGKWYLYAAFAEHPFKTARAR